MSCQPLPRATVLPWRPRTRPTTTPPIASLLGELTDAEIDLLGDADVLTTLIERVAALTVGGRRALLSMIANIDELQRPTCD